MREAWRRQPPAERSEDESEIIHRANARLQTGAFEISLSESEGRCVRLKDMGEWNAIDTPAPE